jgi:predicted Zn-ribbon and HTH transcriptional regulator
MLTCPLCHSHRIHRSKRKGLFERIVLAMIFVRPFRCLTCDYRFFRGSLAASPDTFRQVGTR